MATVEYEDIHPIISTSSMEISSSQWSESTEPIEEDTPATSDDPNGDNYSIKEKSTGGCYPLVALFWSLFQTRKVINPDDIVPLVEELKVNAELLVDYFDSIASKLKIEADRIYYPKSVPYEVNCKYGGTFSLPATQVWAATYLIKLCSQNNPRPDENANPYGTARGKFNLNQSRQLFVELCWEKAFAKRVGSRLYTRLTKFTNDINYLLKKLKTSIQTTSKKEKPYFVDLLPPPEIISTLDAKINVAVNFKKDKSPMVVEVEPTNAWNFPFSLSIDTKNVNGEFLERNKDCSEVSGYVQEEIITGMLRSALESLQNCNILLDEVASQISSKGLIRKSAGSMKNITCYSALKTINEIINRFIYAKNKVELSDSDKHQLQVVLLVMLQGWSDFVGHAQLVLVKFLELCDVIQICHLFLMHHTKLPLPDVAMIEREVNVKNRFRKYRPTPVEDKMKDYAIESLMEESTLKSVSGSNTSLSIKSGKNMSYEQMMVSTKYPMVLQNHPLEWLSAGKRYNVLLRPIPDFEKIPSDMIVADQAIAVKIIKTECIPTFKLSGVELNKL